MSEYPQPPSFATCCWLRRLYQNDSFAQLRHINQVVPTIEARIDRSREEVGYVNAHDFVRGDKKAMSAVGLYV